MFCLNKTLLLGKFGVFDARMLTVQSNKIITSPNCDFIPEAFIFEDAPIKPMHDGRLGFINCFQWLQLFIEPYSWSACIPRQVAYRGNPVWSFLWWNISQSPSEFILEQGSTFEVGQVHLSKFQQLEAVYQCLDERAQKWVKDTPDYKGHIRVDDWM